MIDEGLLKQYGAVYKQLDKGQFLFNEGDTAVFYYQICIEPLATVLLIKTKHLVLQHLSSKVLSIKGSKYFNLHNLPKQKRSKIDWILTYRDLHKKIYNIF